MCIILHNRQYDDQHAKKKNFNAQRGELRKARGACNVRNGEIREIFVAS
jgi:hypothetical protein